MSAELTEGARIGRYTLGRQLGTGGYGRVYEAVAVDTGGARRTLALKVGRAGSDLFHEARLGGLLRHVNLVDVYEVGVDGDVPYLAMELCPGGSLAARAPLPPRAVVEVGLQVADALSYAHEELGLVHLDLKPANLLLQGATVKVADLGGARKGGVADGRVRGTLGYLAPEVLARAAVDGRTDIWALGVVLRELATGLPPAFARPSPRDTLPLEGLDHMPAEPGRETGGWLDPILSRCLAPDPRDRFQGMAELGAALRGLRVEGPGLAEALGLSPARAADPADLPLVGRAADLHTLRTMLRDPGLVTVRGPPGAGKSRVAREVSRRTRDAWLCDLAGVRTDEEALARLAGVMGAGTAVRDQREARERVAAAVAGRADVLVVLDGYDPPRGSELLTALRSRAPRARFVVTGHRALGLDGERVLDLAPLTEDEAVELVAVAARARGVAVAFGDDRVRELARRLDGIPLALELAASRLGVLGLDDLIAHLSVQFLRGVRAGAGGGTLGHALALACDDLAPDEQRVLSELAVFPGPFTPGATRAVVSTDATGRPLDAVLTALCERSLVQRRGEALRLIGVVREHVATSLGRSTDAELRHGRWICAWADPMPRRPGPSDPVPGHELGDLLCAHERAIERGDPDMAVETGLGLARWYGRHGPFDRALAPLEAARAMAPPGRVSLVERSLALALHGVGREAEALRRAEVALAAATTARDEASSHNVLGNQLRYLLRRDEARTSYERALALWRSLGDAGGEAIVLANLAFVAESEGDVDGAIRLALGAVDGHRRVGDAVEEGRVHGQLGMLYRRAGLEDLAVAHVEQALAVHRANGARQLLGIALLTLGNLHTHRSRFPAARRCYEEALAEFRAVGDRRGVVAALGNLGTIEKEAGWYDRALDWLSAADGAAVGLEGPQAHVAYLGLVLADLGRIDEGLAIVHRALAQLREAGDRASEARLRGNLGRVLAAYGRPGDARHEYAAALASMRAVGNRRSAVLVELDLARLEAADADAIAARAGVARAATEASGDEALTGLVSLAAGDVELRAGDLAVARRAYLDAERRLRAAGDLPALGEALGGLARLDRADGDDASADRRIAQARRIAIDLDLGPGSPVVQLSR